MPRIRTIKPEFFTSEDVMALEPLARLLYIALWCEADRDGRMAYKPKTFKVRYLPSDDCEIETLLDALVTRGLLVVYASEGVNYAHIPTFSAHQHINPRETASQLPVPPEIGKKSGSKKPRVNHASTTRDPRDSDEQVGREGKGRNIKEDASDTRRFFGHEIPEGLLSHSPAIKRWEVYKRERKEPYKTEQGVKAFFERLAKLPDPSEAIAFSMSSEWQGVHPKRETTQTAAPPSKRRWTSAELEATR